MSPAVYQKSILKTLRRLTESKRQLDTCCTGFDADKNKVQQQINLCWQI